MTKRREAGSNLVPGLRAFVRHHPRIACTVALGLGATTLVYLSLIPDSAGRIRGLPLAAAAGITHAVAAAFTGHRIVHPRKIPKLFHSAFWGAGTSLLALLLFSLALTGQTYHPQLGDTHPVLLLAFTFVFAFLGAGWALVLLSAIVGCGLCKLASYDTDKPAGFRV